MCAHVGFTAGACPQAAGEVAISADQAAAFGQAVGSRIALGEWDGSVAKVEAAPHTEVRVTGVYSPRDTDPYSFGDRLTGQAASRAGFDVMLTPEATLTGAVSAPGGSGSADWVQPQYGLDVPLIPGRVDIDRIAPLGSAVASFVQYPLGVQYAGSHQSDAVTVTSGLPAIAAEVATGRDQAAVTVPLLMAQLVLLLACVLWLVLLAAADQRRGEVAVARLRGRGAAGARRLLLAETLPALILGAPLGLGLALALTAVARRVVLSPTPPAELPAGAVYPALLALAATLTLALLSVRRVSRAPIADLLRSVSAHRAGVRLGLLEAMLVAAAGAAFAALVTGSVRGPVGQVAPTLLAVQSASWPRASSPPSSRPPVAGWSCAGAGPARGPPSSSPAGVVRRAGWCRSSPSRSVSSSWPGTLWPSGPATGWAGRRPRSGRPAWSRSAPRIWPPWSPRFAPWTRRGRT